MIELHHLSGGYGRTNVIEDMSIIFPDGKITALIGPNGCGKSTLLHLCCGGLAKTGGEVLLDGQPLSALDRATTAQKVALLPQSRTVPDITVSALALHGRFPWLSYPRVYGVQDKKNAESAMKRIGIWDKRHQLLSRLSGGERQKAYLAMLLTQNTGNVLLDEPTTYLDIGHQLELMELMVQLRSVGKCVISILHDLGAALEVADFVAVMKGGKLLAIETPERILASGAVEQAFGVKLQQRTGIRFERL
jgi:iron complex transport system ATP-binding protein